MQKTMLIAIGVVIALSMIVVLADDDVQAADSTPELYGIEGTGSESDPYQVDSADDLNVIDELSTAMRAGTSIHVVLVNDIDISEVDGNSTGDFIYGFRGTFDGNGYSITGANNTTDVMFYRVYGGSTLTNVVLDTSSTFMLVFIHNDGDFLMSDITVEGWGAGSMSGSNMSPFIAHTFGNLTMDGCTNNADMMLGSYGAVFLGGYARGEGINVTFRDCVNNGDIMGESPSLFIGNPWQTKIGVLTIEGCENNADIIGTNNPNYIAGLSGSGYGGVFDDLNNACSGAESNSGGNLSWKDDDGNYAIIGSYSIEPIAGEGKIEVNHVDLNLNLESDPIKASTNVEASYMVFSIGAYAQGNGTWMTVISGNHVPISSNVATMDLSVGMLVTYDLAKIQYEGVPNEATGTTSNGFPYYVFEVDGETVYAVDFGDTEWSFTNVTSVTIGVTLYDSNDSQMAYTSGTKTVNKPAPNVPGVTATPYYKVYTANEDYINVNLESKFIAENDTLEFTISPKVGYTLADDIVVTAFSTYNESDKNRIPYEVQGNNGVYTISNVKSNVYIYVSASSEDSSGIQTVYHTISYELSNVVSSSDVSSLAYGSPYTTTLTAIGGYSLSGVVVTMGGSVVSDAYDSETGKVSIRNVTGDVVISASAYGNSYDDEDLPPFIPQQPAESDDTTLYIACCAAAAVVALLAIIIVMNERKR